jgi:2-octaprenyl-6-methoxyphenol hydroxylase
MIDVLVVGAGPVGCTFALLASAVGLNVSLIDARSGPSKETRTLALSEGSRIMLTRAGAWTSQIGACAIHAIHTSQQGGFGRVMLTREDANVDALGHVVSYAALQDGLDMAVARAGMRVDFGVRVAEIDALAGRVMIHRVGQDGTDTMQAKVVVLADGGANLNKLSGVAVEEKDYGQSALLAHVCMSQPHRNIAYERFTPQGPAALLPALGAPNTCSLVWVAPHATITDLMGLTDDELARRFTAHFGRRAGVVQTLHDRRSYPLKLRQASSRVAGAVAIIGNAAQAMHPVAGQGFNLGIRDAAVLATCLRPLVEGAGVSTASRLAIYASVRDRDVVRGVAFTDLLASTFLSDATPLRLPRGLALAAVDLLPFARRGLARRMLFGASA